jgi:DNA polymerase
MQAMDSKETIAVENLRFKYRNGNLFIRLPSGRWLTYYQARVEDGQITYMGTDAKGWTRLRTFGGKLVENIVQATARDCLADSVREMVMAGMKPIFHVHDEIICEIPAGDNDWAKIHTEIMGEQRDWEKQFGRGKYDLYHPAPGFTTKYYLKD